MEVNKMPEEKGIMYELLNVDADKVSEEKLRALVKQIKSKLVCKFLSYHYAYPI